MTVGGREPHPPCLSLGDPGRSAGGSNGGRLGRGSRGRRPGGWTGGAGSAVEAGGCHRRKDDLRDGSGDECISAEKTSF